VPDGTSPVGEREELDLSVVVPLFDEAPCVESLLTELREALGPRRIQAPPAGRSR
jgi:hypothetical protein